MNAVILILYTTQYRTGGDKFTRAAKHLAKIKSGEFSGAEIICRAVESKSDFLNEIENVYKSDQIILEFHFIGHSGLYGIMFGTTSWPEQFSPFEWTQMSIPFIESSKFFFHSCRSGRWFAPFIARTLRVKTYGHFWYTTFSTSPLKFSWEWFRQSEELFVISCPGKKSHGIFGSLFKYSGFAKAIPFLEYEPDEKNVDTSYDSVAQLYDDTFSDIRLRSDEWVWLSKSLCSLEGKSILDIGCGNGAWLFQWRNLLKLGYGVDASSGMLEQARRRCSGYQNLIFKKIDGPHLPFEDNSFDSIISVLSFRYLDWDPMMNEILRVLKPGGEVFIVDMVAAPVKYSEVLQFLKNKIQFLYRGLTNKKYSQNLKKMVTDIGWKKMLEYNPMRSEHEMKWYLESRFPGNQVEVINVGWRSRILAFRSGPVSIKKVQKMAFP